MAKLKSAKRNVLNKAVSAFKDSRNNTSGQYKAAKQFRRNAIDLANQIMKKRYPNKPVKSFLKAGEWYKTQRDLLKGTFEPNSLKQYRKK